MARLIDDKFSRGLETTRILLGHPKFTAELADAVRKEGGADRAIDALRQAFGLTDENPFAQTVEEQLQRLREQNAAGGWGLDGHPYRSMDIFTHLAATAPPWPKGRDSYRSLRIRWGEGDEGVALTFERHAAAMKRVHSKFWRWEHLLSGKHPYKGEDVERLRLLNGNATHHAVVEWIVVDLSADRARENIASVRGPKSLADEGLVLGWLIPERVDAIDYKGWCAWFCAGYELNVPGNDESWRHVPCVDRYRAAGKVHLYASWHDYDDSDYSVPVSGE
jgi:hypothetical protein